MELEFSPMRSVGLVAITPRSPRGQVRVVDTHVARVVAQLAADTSDSHGRASQTGHPQTGHPGTGHPAWRRPTLAGLIVEAETILGRTHLPRER